MCQGIRWRLRHAYPLQHYFMYSMFCKWNGSIGVILFDLEMQFCVGWRYSLQCLYLKSQTPTPAEFSNWSHLVSLCETALHQKNTEPFKGVFFSFLINVELKCLRKRKRIVLEDSITLDGCKFHNSSFNTLKEFDSFLVDLLGDCVQENRNDSCNSLICITIKRMQAIFVLLLGKWTT